MAELCWQMTRTTERVFPIFGGFSVVESCQLVHSGFNREQKVQKSPEKYIKVQKSPEKSGKVQKSPD
jgi:hypothetical protein